MNYSRIELIPEMEQKDNNIVNIETLRFFDKNDEVIGEENDYNLSYNELDNNGQESLCSEVAQRYSLSPDRVSVNLEGL